MPTGVHPHSVLLSLETYLDELAQAGQEPPTQTHEYYDRMTKRMHMDFSGLNPWHRDSAEAKFRNQVLRSLHKTADSGRLVRIGKGRDLEFLTPQAAARREEKAAEEARQQEENARRVHALMQQLRGLGVSPHYLRRSDVIYLDSGDWETVIRLAGLGQALEAVSPPVPNSSRR